MGSDWGVVAPVGWLINDCLTCIPNTRTLWHDLLDGIPGLRWPLVYPYVDFGVLAERVEKLTKTNTYPNYIIRNASYFRRLKIDVPTFSFVQDPHQTEDFYDVCNNSAATVVCSKWVHNWHKNKLTGRVEVIPTGIDFNLFKRREPQLARYNLLDDSILFIGDDLQSKGIDILKDLISNTQYNFTCIFKGDTKIDAPNVRCFNRISTDDVINIMSSCKLFLCLSRTEPQHVSGVEAGACGLPIVATNVGWYYDDECIKYYLPQITEWGVRVHANTDIKTAIKIAFNKYDFFDPRSHLKNAGYDIPEFIQKWKDLINEFTN